ncbi:hypothetical protein AVE30378_01424 [Achromobacter veterisilvae]|uniref:Thioesterase domain-containing protein n=1 Tax=Achromobacter veterisilvae TaxID=2069367 RepID=A0A446CBN6_9BURK|nr:PaaI family thioesterase [Achromobacter veterisilvae]SSW65264.1 hypothetical protein AVE30378_01424 [Achromobacter veterisilvae]
MDADVTFETLAAGGWRQKSLQGFAGLIGPLWARRETDGWAYGLLAGAGHLNPAGVVHGGLLTALLDHALSAIAWEALGRRACVTVQLDTHFLRAARAGQFLEVRGRVVQAASSLVFMHGELSVAGEAVVTGAAVLKTIASPGEQAS